MQTHSRFLLTAAVLSLLAACSHAPNANEETHGIATAPVVGAPTQQCDHCDGPAAPEADTVETIAVGESPTRGPANAPVTLVVFSDFQCPFCARAEDTVRQVEETYAGKVRVVFKNAPLPMHDKARLAAKAALAANRQGKFWEYHDALLAHQDALDRASLESRAQALGLDLARFRASLDDPKLDAMIDQDLAEAKRVDAKGTPTFFVNGRALVGAQPFEKFRAKIDRVLAER